MPGLAAKNAASSGEGFRKGAPTSPRKQGDGESARDPTKTVYYNYKVPKQGLSEAGASVNTFIKDIFERIASETSRLAYYKKRSAIAAQEFHTGTRSVAPGELPKHAGSENTNAVTKYPSTK